jgi:hypothetical protein
MRFAYVLYEILTVGSRYTMSEVARSMLGSSAMT